MAVTRARLRMLALLAPLLAVASPEKPVQASAAVARASQAAVTVSARNVEKHRGRTRVEGEVRIPAPPPTVWRAILDFQARVDQSWIVKKFDVYRERGAEQRVRWDLSVAGIDVVYHTIYRPDWARKRIDWSLDAGRKNDLRHAAGTYEIAYADGVTTLTYAFEVESRFKAAAALRRSLASREVKRLLRSVHDRSVGS